MVLVLPFPWFFARASFDTLQLAVSTVTVLVSVFDGTTGLALHSTYGCRRTGPLDPDGGRPQHRWRLPGRLATRARCQRPPVSLPRCWLRGWHRSPLSDHAPCRHGFQVHHSQLRGRAFCEHTTVLALRGSGNVDHSVVRRPWRPLSRHSRGLYRSHRFGALLDQCSSSGSDPSGIAPRRASGAGGSLVPLPRGARAQGPGNGFQSRSLPARQRRPVHGPASLPLGAWRRRIAIYNTPSAFLGSVTVVSVMGIVNAAACSCLPAAYIVYCAYILFYILMDLVHVAAANAQVGSVMELYREASREIREMRRASLFSDPTPAGVALRERMDSDGEILRSYLDDEDRYPARFLGVVVSYGVIRTIVVTLVTVLVALWSILRGLGVFFTMESVCPFP
ncbi:hypothetical protein DFJ74DRAFT_668086 [Hyaloraphidium curvatum]|nr:hypothetical protein DFJ74DRAFT_668086 [Hyaloraphidium curvatum]